MCVVTRAGLVSVTIGEQSGNKKRLNIITKKKIGYKMTPYQINYVLDQSDLPVYMAE